MRTMSIGDLHGKDLWKQIDINNFDKVIFIGDYVDSWDIKDEDILNNLLDLIELKKIFPNKVILLLGNHDIQYLFFPNYSCSGFRNSMLYSLEITFKENIKLFQIAFQEQNYLFTHAGISNKWLKKHNETIQYYKKTFRCKDLGETLNLIFETKDNKILHEVGYARGGSYNNVGGVTWACKKETIQSFPYNFHQIVGHTPIDKILKIKSQDNNSSITYIDCLDKKVEFFKMEI